MTDLPKKLKLKLKKRQDNNALRSLTLPESLIDFSSNDYLGFARGPQIYEAAGQIMAKRNFLHNGATGSRLLSGNNGLYMELEELLAGFHNSEVALVFNSGYDANVGFFASVPQRGDTVLFDGLIHASIRDGIGLGLAKSYKFKHNDLENLEAIIRRCRKTGTPDGEIFVVTESVFSMDGDSPDLPALTQVCTSNHCRLVIDEAHAVGVFGPNGAGLAQEYGLEDALFARIVTFGKAIGCHGAAILGSETLKAYLVNFARSFIYTTGLPPHSLATIMAAYDHLSVIHTPIGSDRSGRNTALSLRKNIESFNQNLKTLNLTQFFIPSQSAIHCCLVPNNERAKRLAQNLRESNFDVRPILSPTVPKGMERLRICLHSYNREEEMNGLLKAIQKHTPDFA
ncbi:8-amino-7-oxononanoate synthase [Flavobacteriaceae bacterium F89]|uniref:8-amino-7-oxononanoate synthase n=1 Tax=Cerina litoralis TaxID=2874477 RepID=A0AAE3ETM6_9FLAO|nr:8-amino-7-oxononanoate synthase [Cerina litoralis]MCG2460872.1 8-amino-7-oxononanoate synthase [Cerina litoralis]